MELRKLALGRYGGLLKRVAQQLPGGWDYDRMVSVELSGKKTERRYAGTLCEEEAELPQPESAVGGHSARSWHVTLYTPWLDRLSDDAVVWVMAHELGHVTAGMPCGPTVLAECEAWEQVADVTARAWGFTREEEVFRHEAPGLEWGPRDDGLLP